MNIYDEWIEAKEAEKTAVQKRREVEDRLTAEWAVPEDFDMSKTWSDGEYKITLTGRMTRKVDAKMVQEIAAEKGLIVQIDRLFNWTASIDAKAWKASAENITEVFTPAITTKPGRPSYKIEKIADGE